MAWSADAYHICTGSRPEDGDGAYRCMKGRLVARASVAPSEIDYINAHGTSTPMGDEIELQAVERLFGNSAGKLAMSSTKSAIGHLLGAAGAVEAVFSVLAIRDNVAPPTLNLDNPSVETAIDFIPYAPKKREINISAERETAARGRPRRHFRAAAIAHLGRSAQLLQCSAETEARCRETRSDSRSPNPVGCFRHCSTDTPEVTPRTGNIRSDGATGRRCEGPMVLDPMRVRSDCAGPRQQRTVGLSHRTVGLHCRTVVPSHHRTARSISGKL